MKAKGLGRTAKRTAPEDREIGWAQAYEKRMRRFNVEVVLVALLALILAVAFCFFTSEASEAPPQTGEV